MDPHRAESFRQLAIADVPPFQFGFQEALHEMARREDHRRKSTGEQMRCVATLAMTSRKSDSFTGYWQRAA